MEGKAVDLSQSC